MAMPYGWHEGNRSEYLALFALSNLGFVTPVPRQEDHFFADFIVHLATMQDQAFAASGRCFAIQIKSGREPLKFDSQRKALGLNGMTIPYFLGVVSKDSQTLSIYSTLARLCHMWKFGREIPVELVPGVEGENVPMPDWDNHRVPLGGPIVKMKLADLDHPKRKKEVRTLFYAVMSYWIKLEEAALAWKEHSVPLVIWQREHATNEVPDQSKQGPWVAAHPSSFPEISQAVQHDLISYGYYVKSLLGGTWPALSLSQATVGNLEKLKQSIELLSRQSGQTVDGMGKDFESSHCDGGQPEEI